ncbi:MAG: RES family NAD+ phosphorylase [Candidatus Nanopelagicales bacterium]
MPVHVAHVTATDTVRLVNSRYRTPLIPHNAESVVGTDPAMLTAWIDLANATNERVLYEHDQHTVTGAPSPILGVSFGPVLRAAFAHSPGADRGGARFNGPDPGHGAWYASSDTTGAIAEVMHHQGRFLTEARALDQDSVYDRYLADMNGTMVMIIAPEPVLLDADDYSASQQFADKIRADGHPAIHYPSVRSSGDNLACLVPAIVQNIRRDGQVTLQWRNGAWA